MSEDPVVERLDVIVSTLKLAFAPQLAAERERVRAEPVAAAILDATADAPMKSADLQAAVADATGVSTRTVRNRLQELVAMGALRQGGAGNSPSYTSTGLI